MDKNKDLVLKTPSTMIEIMEALTQSPQGERQSESERKTLLVDAANDAQMTEAFIQKYRSKPSTMRAFKKEVTRFHFWCKLNNLPYSRVRTSHLSAYLEFCATVGKHNPQFVAPAVPHYFANGMPNPKWQPFTKSLTPKGISYASVVLQTFFEFMCDARYLYGNPWKLLADSEKRPAPLLASADVALMIKVKSLSAESVSVLLREVDDFRFGNELERKHYPRAAFLIRFLLCSGARRAEVANAKMHDIVEIEPNRFVWSVVGKGNKLALVTLGSKLIEHFKQYRCSLGLSPLPQPGEDLPLIGDVRNHTRPLTDDAIYKIVKSILSNVADKVATSNPKMAEQFLKATTHWTRHTFGSELAKRYSPYLTRDQMRHGSVSTTDPYVQNHLDKRFEAVIDL